MSVRAALSLALVAALAAPAIAAETKKKEAPAAAAPAAAAPSDDPVVARVNGTTIHRSEVINGMRGLPPQAQQQPAEKLYAYVLDNLIATAMLSQAAHKAKVQDDPDVKRRLAALEEQLIAQSYVEKLVEKSATDAALKARYDKFVKEAPPREEVHARHILLANEADAKAVIEELKKGGDFAKLAQEKSTDPAGKTSGGDLGYFTKEEMVPEFADTAFKLKPGEITQAPVHTQFGWHVIKVEDRRAAKPPTFDQLKPQLVRDVGREVFEKKLNELKTAAKIEVFNADGSKPGASPPAAAAPAPAPAPALTPGDEGPPIPTLSPATAPPTLAPETAPAPTLSPATKPK
ncbi:MAG TPA: peptidylprolyl isomerase [Stellaceae bacterium]|nr:peptidylprolyl isomerase [Stellaceae bacterium]